MYLCEILFVCILSVKFTLLLKTGGSWTSSSNKLYQSLSRTLEAGFKRQEWHNISARKST